MNDVVVLMDSTARDHWEAGGEGVVSEASWRAAMRGRVALWEREDQ